MGRANREGRGEGEKGLFSLSGLDIGDQMTIKGLAFDGHIDLIERILHHVIGVQLVHATEDDVDVRLMRLREQEELGPGQGLETL